MSKIHKEALNWILRTEGLHKILEKENDPLTDLFIETQFRLICDANPEKPRYKDKIYRAAVIVLRELSEKYNFDSGEIVYEDLGDMTFH